MRRHQHVTAQSGTVKDPVCGMDVDPATSEHVAEHEGVTHHFCSAHCRARFVADPQAFLGGPSEPAPAPPGSEEVEYTCPMHPEIRQMGPGACPICGMALEPVTVTADTGPSAELRDMTRRFWIGAVLTVPVVVLEMGRHLIDPLYDAIPSDVATWAQLLLATPVVLWGGWPFFVRGWQSVRTRNLNMFTLIAMGTGIAWVYSVVATLAPGIFPAAFRNDDERPGWPTAWPLPRVPARSTCTSRRPPSSPSWSCSARSSSSAHGSRPRAPSGPCSTSPRRPRGASRSTAPTRRSPSRTSRSATGSASAPARRSPWTAPSPTAAPRWTSRWSPGSPCRSPRPPATPSSAAPSTRPAPW